MTMGSSKNEAIKKKFLEESFTHLYLLVEDNDDVTHIYTIVKALGTFPDVALCKNRNQKKSEQTYTQRFSKEQILNIIRNDTSEKCYCNECLSILIKQP